MAKIPPQIVEQELTSPREDEWWDFANDLEQRDWSNWDRHPWSWYMELSIRKSEGWFHIKVNPIYKHAEVIHWLNEQEAVYRTSQHEFLIKDSQVATMATLKWT